MSGFFWRLANQNFPRYFVTSHSWTLAELWFAVHCERAGAELSCSCLETGHSSLPNFRERIIVGSGSVVGVFQRAGWCGPHRARSANSNLATASMARCFCSARCVFLDGFWL
jgi:hypothetical protein